MMEELHNKRILVLGLGKTGFSVARYLARRGAIVCVSDTRENPPYKKELENTLPDIALHVGIPDEAFLRDVAMIVISPGIAKDQTWIREAQARGVSVVGDIELFARALQPSQKVVAITGANGKTTTTALTAALIEAAGLSSIAAGNIGEPVLDVLLQCEENERFPDVFVLELSSFQLETTDSLKLVAATVLNVSENHLDRYPGMTEYAEAKARIFKNAALQVLNADDTIVRAMRLPDKPAYYFGAEEGMIGRVSALAKWTLGKDEDHDVLKYEETPILALSALSLNGAHNGLNALAALALTATVLPHFENEGFPKEVIERLAAFQGLPHRMETVGVYEGIRYINDSKATTVVATLAAVSGLSDPVVLILGGDGKKQDFTPLVEAVAQHCRAALLIGRDAPIIEASLKTNPEILYFHCDTLDRAMAKVKAIAKTGDIVLLSPACASIDQFKDYTERGQRFAALAKEGARS